MTGLTTSHLVLQNNGGNNLIVLANANNFQFSNPIYQGQLYNVTILSQPAGLTCSVQNPSGGPVNANVSNVSITCSPITFTVGGNITGLTATGLTLKNGGTNQPIAINS